MKPLHVTEYESLGLEDYTRQRLRLMNGWFKRLWSIRVGDCLVVGQLKSIIWSSAPTFTIEPDPPIPGITRITGYYEFFAVEEPTS